MPPSAILLDFDGVIANTASVVKRAMWEFFRARSYPIDEAEFDTGSLGTKSAEQICAYLLEKHGINLHPEELRSNIWEAQKKCFEISVEFDPSIMPFFEFCVSQNIKLAIGSNSGHYRITMVLEKMGISKYFFAPDGTMHILGASDLTKHKPDPEVWIRCAQMLEVPVSECLVIEDGYPGLLGAKNCGAIGVYYHRFHIKDSSCASLATISVKSFGELMLMMTTYRKRKRKRKTEENI